MPLRINGATSGYIELAAPAVAGTTTLTLPTDSIQPALVKITDQSFTTASTVSINNCFSSLYDNYLITLSAAAASGAPAVAVRLRSGGVDATTNYSRQYLAADSTTVAGARLTGQIYWNEPLATTTEYGYTTMTIWSPFLSRYTMINSRTARPDSQAYIFDFVGSHLTASSYDGITLIPSSSTISGIIRIYGYRN